MSAATYMLSDYELECLAREHDDAMKKYLSSIEPYMRALCKLYAMQPKEYLLHNGSISERPREEYWSQAALEYERWLKEVMEHSKQLAFERYNRMLKRERPL